MKNINKILIALFVMLPFAFISCDDDIMETNKGNTPLELMVNATDVTLDILDPSANVLSYTWTTGINHGTNTAISYQFQLALNETDFQDGITYELGKGSSATSMVYTNESLNATLLDSLGVEPNTEVYIKARVIATVLSEGIEPQITEPIMVKIKTYKPISKNIYILGSAAPNGWNADEATQMNVVSGTVGGFTWQGRLNAGEMKFITTLGDFLPSYNKGDAEYKLVYRDSDDQPDNKFVIPASGMYKITLNILTLAINIEVMEAPEYGTLWFVGGSTGWNFKEMRNDMLDPYIFHFNAELLSPDGNAVEDFKIATVADFEPTTVYFRPEVNNQGVGTDLTVVKWSENENDDDYKWSIAPGTYKIKLNIRTMKINIVKYELYPVIYLVGEATPNGWDIGSATPMSAVSGNPHKFTWTGNLSTGDMKFSCDRQDDWGGGFFLASRAEAAPSGSEEQMLYSPKGSEPDNKWRIPEAGTYTIELDQLQDIMKFTKH
ncbi:SusF/SusE family outer membrane protein [Dysgonomonas sp. 520]|uniref:SusF/SusE family outer membrane protein n=1 Tax=Dysgonomonas sp. 520 TaxID=2302931 RepID=UPI0013D037E0|nr:SusF/SusE family outer membrane protein [Dysgonomonas sp. 520]NDW11051.1 SusF/SusE family outer membrane protein [Dysgonomonas sp. 520]